MQDLTHMLTNNAAETFSRLEMVLDQMTELRHLVFGTVTIDLLYSVASKLPALETLCAAAVHDGNSSDCP